MRKPLFYFFVPLVLASKIYQTLCFFWKRSWAYTFHTLCWFCTKLLDFGTPSKSRGVQKGAHFGISGTEKAPKATRWASKIWSFLVPFPPAAVLTPRPPQGVPRAALLMDVAHISTSLGYIFPHFFRFRTQGKNKSSKLKTLFKQQRSRAPQTEHQQHNALIVTLGPYL